MANLDPKPLEDFSMWTMLQRGGQKPNITMLRELVGQWVQMATQKTAGQRNGNRKDLSWDNMERVKMGILCEAVAPVLSGDLNKLEAMKKWRMKREQPISINCAINYMMK